MTNFDRREEAFEAKFAHDQERAFKARARALHMLGLWAAEKRGETGAAAEAYARALIDADVGAASDAAFNRLLADLAGHGVDAEQIRKKRDELLAIAQQNPA
ncbi:DUF1476 domain-containing protein [Bradyrhizobium sp.]|uniref:DUF1476 domain-containing protein n=1 Tax=Bradyrhizobium sp. TaxID=376 RepID=UPI003C5BE20A